MITPMTAGSGPILVVAPHPDDETFGAGGLLLRARASGCQVHWLIVTNIWAELGWSEEKVERRQREIAAVADAYGFTGVHRLDLPAARLDTLPIGEIVTAIGTVVKAVSPETMLIPHGGDAHTDHHVVFTAAASCSKWFRYPSVRQVLVYEALSETDAGLYPFNPFVPNLFLDIELYLEEKLRIATLFGDELSSFPFPRSLEAVKALAMLRGAACGVAAAEAFMLLRARI